jgi:hypothetical protein
MPFRIGDQWPNRCKVQFTTSAATPSLVYKACLATGVISNTVYIQHAVCEALSRDLGIPLEDLLADLPEPRGRARDLIAHGVVMPGPANTIEDVR